MREREKVHQGLPGQEEWGLSTSGAGGPFPEMEHLQLDSGDACTASGIYFMLRSDTVYNINNNFYLMLKFNHALKTRKT